VEGILQAYLKGQKYLDTKVRVERYKKRKYGSCWWLTPVVLATQEAEIRRIVVQSQPGQIVLKNLSGKKPSQIKGWWSGSGCRP
jgi:hypothetical protein